MPSGIRQIVFGDPCKGCGVTLDKFNGVYKAHRLTPWCNDCSKIQLKKRLCRTKEYRAETYMLWSFGLTRAQYDTLIKEQGGGCGICGGQSNNGRRLSIDHCHVTDKIRGILCNNCNTALGMANDSIDILSKMIQYLSKHGG